MRQALPLRSPSRPPVRRGWKVALVLLIILAWTPILVSLLSAAAAAGFVCPLNEATAHPCLVAGVDIGEAPVVVFLMGWLAVWARRTRGSSPS